MTEPRTPVTPELRAEIRSFCPPDGFVVALLDALEAAEGRITSLVVSGAEVTAARNDARAELRTAREALAECKTRAKVLGAAIPSPVFSRNAELIYDIARAALGQEGADVRTG